MRAWMLCVALVLLGGALLGALSGCGHNPNHGIDPEQAREAARQIKPPPKPGVKMKPGHGG